MDTPLPFNLLKSIQERLSGWNKPVITDYELAVLITRLTDTSGQPPDIRSHQQAVDNLLSTGLLLPDKDFRKGTVYRLFGKNNPAATEVACAVDPFAYVSHLSAMEYHGLTDRFPKILYLTTPDDKAWRTQADARMAADLGERLSAYRQTGLPVLRRQPSQSIEGHHVELMRRSHLGAFRVVRSTGVRVATIGRTFLDMVREPELCGGILHVIDVYRSQAAQYLSLIVDDAERHGTAIDKVRLGFLLTEVCHLSDPRIEGWTRHAQRGGSRKLDPQAEYDPRYSEKWMLSINVPTLHTNNMDDAHE
mgnify:FL=1